MNAVPVLVISVLGLVLAVLVIRAVWARVDRNADCEKHAKLQAYWTLLLAQEDVMRAHMGAPRIPCPTCGEKWPQSALLETQTGLICAKCSPQARAAGMGFYKPKKSGASS